MEMLLGIAEFWKDQLLKPPIETEQVAAPQSQGPTGPTFVIQSFLPLRHGTTPGERNGPKSLALERKR